MKNPSNSAPPPAPSANTMNNPCEPIHGSANYTSSVFRTNLGAGSPTHPSPAAKLSAEPAERREPVQEKESPEWLCLQHILEEARAEELAAGQMPTTTTVESHREPEEESDDATPRNSFLIFSESPLSFSLSSVGTAKKKRRTVTTPFQTRVLQKVLALTNFPSSQMRRMIAEALELTPRTVQVWYQNRRQKERSRLQAQERKERGDEKSTNESGGKVAPSQPTKVVFHSITTVHLPDRKRRLEGAEAGPPRVTVERIMGRPAAAEAKLSSSPSKRLCKQATPPSESLATPFPSPMQGLELKVAEKMASPQCDPLELLAMAALEVGQTVEGNSARGGEHGSRGGESTAFSRPCRAPLSRESSQTNPFASVFPDVSSSSSSSSPPFSTSAAPVPTIIESRFQR
ncbi:uncharacterized protein VTP21DRAFT_9172 [Calcarisporiella thermophila]|uniref:uncharacterized protein n=1 Tax=Calcarisporiella thermophila TaxID=911321 RepID=UPI00374330BE